MRPASKLLLFPCRSARAGSVRGLHRALAILFAVAVLSTPAAWAHKDGFTGQSAASGTTSASGVAAPAGTAAPQTRGVWKDPDGNPLPFQSDEEIIEFLQDAKIVAVEDIPVGVTDPRRVTLVKDGVEMRAALRDFDETHEQMRFNRVLYPRLRDSFVFDIGVYELSKILGLNNVPPVTLRRVNGVDASLQIWVEGALVEFDRVEKGIAPPESENLRFMRQYQLAKLFDTLIGNIDRNNGNILFDEDWNFWLIDHSRSFVHDDRDVPYLEQIYWCERSLFEKLKALTRDELMPHLHPPIEDFEIDWMLKRRDLIVARLEQLIAVHGESAVLYDGMPQ